VLRFRVVGCQVSGYSQHIIEYLTELVGLLKSCSLNDKAIPSFIAALLQVPLRRGDNTCCTRCWNRDRCRRHRTSTNRWHTSRSTWCSTAAVMLVELQQLIRLTACGFLRLLALRECARAVRSVLTGI
jgi:hypothetical protein